VGMHPRAARRHRQRSWSWSPSGHDLAGSIPGGAPAALATYSASRLVAMALREERSATALVTPGICLACVTVTAAGLIKAATSGTLSLSQLTLVIALGTAYALLLAVALPFLEQRGTKVHLYIVLAVAVALAAAAVEISRGAAFLLLMPLITYAVLF